MELEIKSADNQASFPVKVVPRASRNAITEVREGALVVRLCASPVEGKANAALTAYIAEFLGLRKNQVSIKMGEKSRHKVVTISGLSVDKIREKLEAVLAG